MFGQHLMFRLVAAVFVAASIAVVGARTAKAAAPHRSVSSARHAQAQRSQRFRIITDTLGGNGSAPSLPLGGGGGGRAVV